MLHIVQVVLAGSAEAPQVFSDETAARAAFVACAKRYWAQSYAAWCERNGADGESFAAAQGFVASFDLADRSRIHYWDVTPEDGGSGWQQSGIQRLGEAAGTIRKGLDALLEVVAALGGDGQVELSSPAARGEVQALRSAAAATPPSFLPPDAEPLPARDHDTAEWRAFVQSVMNMCGGSREEFHLFNRHDWRQAVYGNETALEYWEWVAVQIDDHIHKARHAGYGVVADPDQPGCFRYRTPGGIVSDAAEETEDEAWCRAGLHLEGK